MNQSQYLSNYAPTTPLPQKQSTDDQLGLLLLRIIIVLNHGKANAKNRGKGLYVTDLVADKKGLWATEVFKVLTLLVQICEKKDRE